MATAEPDHVIKYDDRGGRSPYRGRHCGSSAESQFGTGPAHRAGSQRDPGSTTRRAS